MFTCALMHCTAPLVGTRAGGFLLLPSAGAPTPHARMHQCRMLHKRCSSYAMAPRPFLSQTQTGTRCRHGNTLAMLYSASHA